MGKATFTEKLNRLMEEKHLSQSELARRVGVTSPTVNGWCNGKTGQIRVETGIKVAKVLGVSPSWLFLNEGVMNEQSKDSLAEYVSIPYVKIKFAAGEAIETTPEEQADQSYVMIKRTWFESRHVNAANCRMFDVSGNSMEPQLCDGDHIIVDVSDTTVISEKIYAFIFGNGLRVKKLIPLIKGGFKVKSVNPDYSDEFITPEDLDRPYFKIIGRVVAKVGAGGL